MTQNKVICLGQTEPYQNTPDSRGVLKIIERKLFQKWRKKRIFYQNGGPLPYTQNFILGQINMSLGQRSEIKYVQSGLSISS